ncbi:FAD-dependent oxidoreductase [Nitratiruptor sp. SB155-2]|uniref:FAD-dependent oxidoreductase n=1 Tax=Nitratiruptor sp. (strain SB155-2) TaxID=387092 RepID=UPI0001586DF8|nr:FAD-dependent oxidoreductase [Nitratiruptor sp. SB155-2]BAF69124.1 succinate dehydrogenase/fumarate reductase, flavoprotein subunit [Nitratiruptor sp. SB155-2]
MVDILVIGSGGAGLSAALRAKELGKDVLVVTKKLPTQAQTSMAQGGINAALRSPDSVESHIEDTLRSSEGLADSKVVEYVCNEAPKVIHWLDSIGMPFDRNGTAIAQRKLGGASYPRACYAQDYTGLKILHTLYDNALKAGITFLDEHFLLNIIEEDGVCKGATFLDIKTSAVKQILAKSVILATGGYAKIYEQFSTNGIGAYGEGVAAAMRAGAKLSDLEFIQFHPTALKKSSILISEAARGAGGKLINQDGQRFTDELTTRDKLARAIYEEIEKGNEVFLDITHLGEDFIEKNLPQERKLALIYEGVDPVKEPVPIKPAAHYTMGGIDVDENLQTSIKHLFAVGECSNAKLHGANRLGGNSLLEIVALGRLAGENAASVQNAVEEKEYERTKIDQNFIHAVFALPNQIDFFERQEMLSKILYHNCGIVREELALKGVLSVIRQHQRELAFMGIKDKSPLYNTELIRFFEYGNVVELSEAVLVGAIQRCESRGAHFRKDYPKKDDDKFLAHTIIWKEDGVLCADFVTIST